jgi:hypothetical protein
MGKEENQAAVSEIRRLLKCFRKLRSLLQSPISHGSELWLKAKEEASEELKEELKQRSQGCTLRPSGPMTVRRGKRRSQIEQSQFDDQVNRIIEAKAERKYRALDLGYRDKLKAKEGDVRAVVKEIDHLLTPIREDIRRLSEAGGTLLVADWTELRQQVSIDEIIKLDDLEQFDRTIGALQIIEQRLRRRRLKRVIAGIAGASTALAALFAALAKLADSMGRWLQR